MRGAGGYQMFGVTPAPIFDPPGLPYLEESMVFFRAGDIVQFRPIERTEYERMAAEVEAGTFDLRIRPVSFDLDAFSPIREAARNVCRRCCMSIKVLKPGLATSVRDAGREGHYHLVSAVRRARPVRPARGQPAGGHAPTAAVLECALLGPQLEFQRDAPGGRVRARMTPRLEGAEMPLILPSGFAPARYRGSTSSVPAPVAISPSTAASRYPRCWAAVRPTVWGDRWLAGTATGGGRPAAPGACLALCRGGLGAAALVAGGGRWRGELAVVPGLYVHRLTPDAVERFFAETWTVGSEADRTGYRFKGRHGAPVRAARTAIRRRLGPVQHRRRLLSHRLDPGTGRARTHRPAS